MIASITISPCRQAASLPQLLGDVAQSLGNGLAQCLQIRIGQAVWHTDPGVVPQFEISNFTYRLLSGTGQQGIDRELHRFTLHDILLFRNLPGLVIQNPERIVTAIDPI